ncbi:LysR family transcriptional regulator [Murimonas intestini]|uniref:LysR family transcriptional regulator n=1 Tax=Murimonas intestini TaxID=1337051 RepID=UPI0011DD7BBD|nr:LysR family transcriptional regulator [Murimonas intestini]
MELRVLRYFLTAVNEGNITRAADILHVTQPTLSRQLIDLERELGTTLLIRGKRSLTLTDDGMLFRQQAEEIVELADRAEQTFSGKKDTISGVITIGATEAMGGRALAKYMGKFMEMYPNVSFDLYNEMADNIKDKLDKGLLDLGLLLEPVDTSKYEFLRLSRKETWGILLRKDHPLMEKETIYVQDLRPYPLILPKRENARNEVLNWMECEESHLKVPVNYNLLSNVALLVEAGIGSAICLDGALSIYCSEEICFRPVLPERTTRSVLLWKKNHLFHPAASLFIQMLHTHKWDEE